jgi:hypothetical protein
MLSAIAAKTLRNVTSLVPVELHTDTLQMPGAKMALPGK